MSFERQLPAYAEYRKKSGVSTLQVSRSGAETIRNPWSRKPGFWNLSGQFEITKRDPALAERLREAAECE